MGCSRVLPSKVCCCSLDLGLQVIVFLCQKVGIGFFKRSEDKSLNTTVMLPSQSVFVNAFSIIVFYRRWLAACLSFDLLGLFAVDFMVDLFLILAIANFSWLPSFWFSLFLSFYGCPLYDTFHWYFCHFSLKMLPLFVCLLMLFKCSLSNIDRHFVTERLRNCEKCVLAKVIQWIR